MTTVERFEKNIDQVNSDFKGIRDKLIECGVEVAEGTRTAEYAEKVGELRDVIQRAEYDEFWDAYQQNGERTNYNNAFGGLGWTDALFKPKYNITASQTDMMFGNCAIKDLGDAIRKAGITLTLPAGYGRVFQNAECERIGGITLKAPIRSMSYSFYGCRNLVSIDDDLHLTDNGNCTFDRVFMQCSSLEHLIIGSGVIGQNGFNVGDCTKLSKESITSIINHLSDTTSGLTVTLSYLAVEVGFETEGDAGTLSAPWLDLIATKPNWNISLV